MGCKRGSSTLDHIYVYNHYIQIHSASPDQGNTQYTPNCATNAVCTTVLLYLYAYECREGLLTDSEVVDVRSERRRDTMDLLREAKSSNSAKLGSTPIQSSCSG